MKKFIIVLITSLVLPNITFAAVFYSSNSNSLKKSETKILHPITISAEQNNEITSENGIRIFIPSGFQILWDNVSLLNAYGSAVDNNKISSAITPVYENNYSVIYIPVKEDFNAEESVVLSGLRMRAYNQHHSFIYLQLDLNNDGVSDKADVNSIKIIKDNVTDFTPPYPVTNVIYNVSSDYNSIDISWSNPPDYDIINIFIDKKFTRNGLNFEKRIFLEPYLANYTDVDIKLGDEITYSIYAYDYANFGEKYIFNITVEDPTEQPIDEPVAETELDELNRLFNYYKIRYAIKCMPSGVAVPENDSACLWARIDLVYAQELLDRSDVDTSLTERDIYLMGIRLKYPEQRYQDNCVDAIEPAGYCSALSKALNRIHYFVD